jgi:hypothetical protein
MGSDPLQSSLDVFRDGWWLRNYVSSWLVALRGEKIVDEKSKGE